MQRKHDDVDYDTGNTFELLRGVAGDERLNKLSVSGEEVVMVAECAFGPNVGGGGLLAPVNMEVSAGEGIVHGGFGLELDTSAMDEEEA